MRTGGMRVGNRCHIQAGTQISPSSRVARRLCCDDPETCLYREACNRYTEPVPMAAGWRAWRHPSAGPSEASGASE